MRPPDDLIATLENAPVPEAAKMIAEETIAAADPSGHGGPSIEHEVVAEDLAEDLAKFIEWPVRYDVEIMSKSALLRNLPPERPPQPPPPQPQQQQHQEEEEEEMKKKKEEGGGGDINNVVAYSNSSTTDHAHAVGIAVSPWLRWAALREAEDELASHAATPHMRRRWKCTACGVSMMAFYHEIDKHRATCRGSAHAQQPSGPEENDPTALPSSFGKDGRKGPSLQEELTTGANLGLPREALGFVSRAKTMPTTRTGADGGNGDAVDGREEESEGGGGGGAVEKRVFTCVTCGDTLNLTPPEILKHRRSCGR